MCISILCVSKEIINILFMVVIRGQLKIKRTVPYAFWATPRHRKVNILFYVIKPINLLKNLIFFVFQHASRKVNRAGPT